MQENLLTILDRGTSAIYVIPREIKHVWSVDQCKQFIEKIRNNHHDCLNVVVYREHEGYESNYITTVGADYLLSTTLLLTAIVNTTKDSEIRSQLAHMVVSRVIEDGDDNVVVSRMTLNNDDAGNYEEIILNNLKDADRKSPIAEAYRVFVYWLRGLDNYNYEKTVDMIMKYLSQTKVYVTEVLDEEDALILYNKVK